uniref:Uncharacterized protein n=1 Tax=Plectus sambesii TaxID=2011161 RepID=A0A914X1L1_9BILA
MNVQLSIQEQGRVKVVQARAELAFFRDLKKSKHMQSSIVNGQLQPALYPKSAFFASTRVNIKQLLEVAVPLEDVDHHFHQGSWKYRYHVKFPALVGLAWQSTRGGSTAQHLPDCAMAGAQAAPG